MQPEDYFLYQILAAALIMYVGFTLYIFNYDKHGSKWNIVATWLGVILTGIPMLKLIVWFILE